MAKCFSKIAVLLLYIHILSAQRRKPLMPLDTAGKETVSLPEQGRH